MKIKLSIFFGLILFALLIARPLMAGKSWQKGIISQAKIIAQGQLSLEDRYDNEFVNQVMKDNILLTLAYLRGKVKNPEQIDWSEIEKPFDFRLELQPNSTFAFHDVVLEQYKGRVVATTNSHFNSAEGFKSDGYLIGDGVCHLASIINWVAKDANLEVVAPTSHDFAKINDIPKKYGVSIYTNPGAIESSKLQNLYITNNYNKPIVFVFTYEKNSLNIKVEESML